MKNNKEYLDKIVKILEPPYFYELGLYGIDSLIERKNIFSKIYGENIIINYDSIYDSDYNLIYWEGSSGFWVKREYDKKCNIIYQENSFGEIFDKRK